jgi:hypothetical protein
MPQFALDLFEKLPLATGDLFEVWATEEGYSGCQSRELDGDHHLEQEKGWALGRNVRVKGFMASEYTH